MKNSIFWRMSGGASWWPIFILGVGLVLFAVLVLLHPEILAYLIAFFLLTAGLGLIGTALTLRKSAQSDPFQMVSEEMEWQSKRF